MTHRSYLKSRAQRRSLYSIPRLLSDRNSTLIYLVEISTENDVSYMYTWSKHAVDRTHPKRTIFKSCTPQWYEIWSPMSVSINSDAKELIEEIFFKKCRFFHFQSTLRLSLPEKGSTTALHIIMNVLTIQKLFWGKKNLWSFLITTSVKLSPTSSLTD